MAQTVSIFLNCEDRKCLEEIVGDRSRALKHIQRAKTMLSVANLEDEISRYIKEHNKTSKPFVWTTPAKAIFDKVAKMPEPSV